jgi:hypothetical protein
LKWFFNTGYHVWPKKVGIEKRMQASKKEQLKWFCSKQYLETDLLKSDPDLQAYVERKKNSMFCLS